jgi:hypothetical protein
MLRGLTRGGPWHGVHDQFLVRGAHDGCARGRIVRHAQRQKELRPARSAKAAQHTHTQPHIATIERSTVASLSYLALAAQAIAVPANLNMVKTPARYGIARMSTW